MTETAEDQAHAGDHGKGKSYVILVNGTPATVSDKQVTFAEVVAIAYPVSPGPDTTFTVTFRRAHKPHEGIMVEGQTVEVRKEGTSFDVVATGKS
ncbi:multiubiquitin domain-containing protein [Nocardia fluminea]|uniref:multiubiquitin domain-containing protein n=1 Tax=Nocardia fluminea TaxID=134984 RepID=UPI00364D051F